MVSHEQIAIDRWRDNHWRSKVERTASGCMVWQGAQNKRGYGRVNINVEGVQRSFYVHALAFTVETGVPWPRMGSGKTLDHLCSNPPCCNPDHIELVEHLVNVNRGEKANRTHCPLGHPYEGANLYVDPKGTRRCRQCRRERWRV